MVRQPCEYMGTGPLGEAPRQAHVGERLLLPWQVCRESGLGAGSHSAGRRTAGEGVGGSKPPTGWLGLLFGDGVGSRRLPEAIGVFEAVG